MIRLSPSRMVTIRRGTLSRCAIAVAATASVGETIAPSTNAVPQLIPPMAAWATTATVTIVASTSPIASRDIGRRFARMSRSDEKNAAE